MGMLLDGEWTDRPFPLDERGRFARAPTTFRGALDPGGPHPPAAGRYLLYVSLACPWAHRTLIVRQLKGLTGAVDVAVVDHFMGDDGWFFSDNPGAIKDPVFDAQYLREIYLAADPRFTGRVTVPILWDRAAGTIVNNESRDIIQILDRDMEAFAKERRTFFPAELQTRIDETLDAIYEPINNGVYRAGFAGTQDAYYAAVTELFEALDHWEQVLATQRYLLGDQLTAADVCLFTTLVRFDLVYHGHFKCNLRRIVDYPNLYGYLKDLYQEPGVRETCNFEHMKRHYYESHRSLNPRGIVPKGPLMALGAPHDRQRFSLAQTSGSSTGRGHQA